MTYTKADVEFHSDMGRELLPAVNVKVYRTFYDVKFPVDDAPDDLTLEWIEENVDEERLSWVWSFVCEGEFEYYADWAKEIFQGYSISVEQEGRSGGWAVVRGLPDLEDWDAVLLAKWRKFERIGRELARGIPEQVVVTLGINEYETWLSDQAEEAGLHRDLIPA